jgi:hypothetical protein
MYEKGNLRYIKLGGLEVIRMIYTAVRDENWETAACELADEEIEENATGFSIRYTAKYTLREIDYKASVIIEGRDNSISLSMKGIALSSFQSNRVGLCVLHPIKECAGKKVVIKQPDGTSYESTFPELISPNQPFKQVQQMQWSVDDGVEVQLIFEAIFLKQRTSVIGQMLRIRRIQDRLSFPSLIL